MKVDIDELEAAGEKAAETEQAVAEGMGAEPGGGNAMGSAMREFVEFKKAERELKQTILEEEGTSGMDKFFGQLSEFLKDPMGRKAVAKYFLGRADENGVEAPPETEQLPEPETTETETMTQGTPVTAEQVYELIYETLKQIKDQQPDITAEEMVELAGENKPMIMAQIENHLEELDNGGK